LTFPSISWFGYLVTWLVVITIGPSNAHFCELGSVAEQCVYVYVFVEPQLRNVWVKQNRTHSRGQQYIRNLSDFDFSALSRGFRVCSLLVYLSVF